MGNNIAIRKMTPQDVPTVAAIDHVSFSLPWPERSFAYEVSVNPVARCWVAEGEDKRIAAMLVLWLIIDEVHIATLATHPDFRRQGIGAQILTASLKDAARAGATHALLEVRETNEAALSMYRKFGFEVSGRRPKYYKDNGEDAILMTLHNLEVSFQ